MRTPTSLLQIHTIFAKPYIFYELPIRMNLYECPKPNPAPKPTLHWGLDKYHTSEVIRCPDKIYYEQISSYMYYVDCYLILTL